MLAGLALAFRRLPDGILASQYLEYIQRTNFNNFVKGDQFYKNLSGLLGDGIFCVSLVRRSCLPRHARIVSLVMHELSLWSSILTFSFSQVDGHSWQLQRKTTAKIFTANNFKGVITQSLENQMAKLIAIIGRHADRGEGVHFSLSFSVNSH